MEQATAGLGRLARLAQVENRESLARQYGLANYARVPGWPPERILLIDENLGLSGRTAEARLGFQRMLAEVSMDHVRIASREFCCRSVCGLCRASVAMQRSRP